MGERLVIQVVKDTSDGTRENVLLTGYYHWSGFTPCVREILRKMYKTKPQGRFNHQTRTWILVREYIDRLANTGAGFIYDGINEDNVVLALMHLANLPKGKNRNDGLLDILPEGCAESIRWADENIIVHADKGWLNLSDAFWEVSFDLMLDEKGITVEDEAKLDEASRKALDTLWQNHIKNAVNCPFEVRHLAETDVIDFCNWLEGTAKAVGESFIFKSGDNYYQTIY